MSRLRVATPKFFFRSLVGVLMMLSGSAALPQAEFSVGEELRALVGRIEGLEGPGLVLVDGLGTMVRPFPGASRFAFNDGRPYIKPLDQIQLAVARQPLGQTCRVASEGGDDQSDTQQAMVFCVSAQPSPMTMRDCFQVLSSGASFRLGKLVDGQWVSFADVSMDPVGGNRLHHRTTVDGRIVLETITLLSDDRPRAVVEVRVLGAALGGQLAQSTGDQEGMPLDLAVGEERSYAIESQKPSRSGQTSASKVQRRWVKLLGVGPLDTRVGRFPLACHLQEWGDVSGDDPQVWNVWYAPGYGPVRVLSAIGAGSSAFSLEVTEILRRPK